MSSDKLERRNECNVNSESDSGKIATCGAKLEILIFFVRGF